MIDELLKILNDERTAKRQANLKIQ